MPFEWDEIPRHYSPRQRDIILEARAYAENMVQKLDLLDSAYPAVAQAFIDGYSAGWDASVSRALEFASRQK